MKNFEVKAKDGHVMHGAIYEPSKSNGQIFLMVHGMYDHKERHYKIIEYYANEGFISVIYDVRGHGKHVKDKNDLGDIGEKNILIEDLDEVIDYIKSLYPDLLINLLGYSMGSLVVRNYIQKYDEKVDKAILVGSPTYNSFAGIAQKLIFIEEIFKGKKHHSKFFNYLALSNHNKGCKVRNEWLTTDKEVLDDYNNDELCNFVFTLNGFNSLFYMLGLSYNKKKYKCSNKDLSILLLGGEKDPVVGGKKKFDHLYKFLTDVGYKNIEYSFFPNMNHDLFTNIGKEKVYEKTLEFMNRIGG